jgi:hypothetical protein
MSAQTIFFATNIALEGILCSPYLFLSNQIYSGIPIPERVRVRRASLHDANGNPGGTSLFPMRHNLHALMLHKQALFRTHGVHTFMDCDGIMYEEKAAEF